MSAARKADSVWDSGREQVRDLWLRTQRRLRRSVWLARLLQLPDSEGDPNRPGLLLVQIDGLSRLELERALESGETPFMRRLLRRGDYRLHSLYSGLPSTTPAVQAELFYGLRGGVPAFAFRENASGRLVRMYEPAAATRAEAGFAAGTEPGLLEGGSAYADAVTGGAAEPHFCPAAIGWGPTLRAANPLVVAAFLIANLYSFVRVGVLLVLELGLALVDFARGLRSGHDLGKELKFVPTRVAIAILLRELCVIGGKIDLGRGLPVVHINLLGYDEQAHRRGPGSLFAHWSLKGIDDGVARLWRAARGSPWRRYQVWIYSDHGQAAVRTYEAVQGWSIESAVLAALEGLGRETLARVPHLMQSIQTHRVRLLGGRRLQRLFAVLGGTDDGAGDGLPLVAALGPVAHVYLPGGLGAEAREALARDLVQNHGVPAALTLAADQDDGARAWTAQGPYQLPRERDRLFGRAHPFLDEIGEDAVRLCRHPDAGDIVLLGWRHGMEPLTFATENGAHGGASPQETHAFALLPETAPLAPGGGGCLRPARLRQAGLRHLGREAADTPVSSPAAGPDQAAGSGRR